LTLGLLTTLASHDLYMLLTALLMADVVIAAIAAAGDTPLEAGVVSLYGVLVAVLLFARWVRGVCARLGAVHSGHPFCGPGPGELQLLRGHFLYYTLILSPL
jgi:hypothetical protein